MGRPIERCCGHPGLRAHHQLHHPRVAGRRLHSILDLCLWPLLQLPDLCWLHRLASHQRRINATVTFQPWQGRASDQSDCHGLPQRSVGLLVLPDRAAPDRANIQLDHFDLRRGSHLVVGLLLYMGKEGIPWAGRICSQGRVVEANRIGCQRKRSTVDRTRAALISLLSLSFPIGQNRLAGKNRV
jgi:hypothetical protein